ncbi:MAG: 2-hydroxychromene-2-carboxylate isomerase [Alphaproteobacteria bacterium]|nr:2-hydroxychromene-2-carboxylate isomerase [Alphaproteobacteria bacterium]
MRTADLWFDLLSPYAYFAWKRVRPLLAARDVAVRPQPVLLAVLLDHWGQLGPAEVPPKRVHTFKTCLRYAARHGLPFRGPATHPFNPVTALRVCLPEVAGDQQEAVIDALFDAGWGAGVDLGDPVALATALSGAGLDGPALLARTQDPAVKAALKSQGARALALGVFGVPTVTIDGELFWGNDALDELCAWLDGDDPLDAAALERFLARPAGVVRQRAGG